jgi:hypothetical protein
MSAPIVYRGDIWLYIISFIVLVGVHAVLFISLRQAKEEIPINPDKIKALEIAVRWYPFAAVLFALLIMIGL